MFGLDHLHRIASAAAPIALVCAAALPRSLDERAAPAPATVGVLTAPLRTERAAVVPVLAPRPVDVTTGAPLALRLDSDAAAQALALPVDPDGVRPADATADSDLPRAIGIELRAGTGAVADGR